MFSYSIQWKLFGFKLIPQNLLLRIMLVHVLKIAYTRSLGIEYLKPVIQLSRIYQLIVKEGKEKIAAQNKSISICVFIYNLACQCFYGHEVQSFNWHSIFTMSKYRLFCKYDGLPVNMYQIIHTSSSPRSGVFQLNNSHPY